MESGSEASNTFNHLLCELLYSIISPTLAIRAPQVALCTDAVESPTSLTMRYLSPFAGVPGSNVAGLMIFFTAVSVLAGMVSSSMLYNNIVSSSVVVAIVPIISLPFGCVNLICDVPLVTTPYCSSKTFQFTGGPNVSKGSASPGSFAPV